MSKKKKQNTGNKRSQMSNLEIAIQNVEAAFREGEKAGITVKKAKWRKTTYADYKDSVITMLNDIARLEGSDFKRLLPKFMNGTTWDKYFEVLSNRYEEDKLSAGQIQRRVNALEAFRVMVRETNVLGKGTTIRVGNKVERLDYLKLRGVYRSKDEITAIKPSNDEINAVHSNINTKTKKGKISLAINELQVEIGGRIKSIFKLEVRDIDFNKKTITFRNDKNNFTRTVPMTVAAEKILLNACHEKKPGSPVFTMVDSKGNDMSLEKSVKTVQRYTNVAAKRTGVNRENRRFTTHSNRKKYAQNMYDKTHFKSKQQLKKEIGKYVRNQGSNQQILVERMKKELERINVYRKMNGKDLKGFSHEHLRLMLVSLHLGHSRCDVVLSYITPDPIRKK
ncbi:tyrosine-type recombinase/integrase [Peribacillus sp. NJ11]|uniref:tyrosine-type recombinase/integrase n=1 Tax=Peribacillus sp. NJ11 TaxID=3055861 RepID=UPI0025A11841|nr:tyrosine-type recombinase/integrase [Peribacillus sp. NJ11]MDM5220811.1 tyrosine-type recombinase/integrase [Peribacillus sp. NJ11]